MVVTRGPGDQPRPHGGHTGPRGLATHPQRPHKVHGTGYAPTAATRGPGTGHAQTAATHGSGDRPRLHNGHTGPRSPATPKRLPRMSQGTGHAPTAATRGPGDRPRTHGGHTGPRGPGTPPRRPHGAQGTGHAPTAATRGPGTCHASTAATWCPRDRPRLHKSHTGPWEPATPPRQRHVAQWTSHAPRPPHGTLGTGLAPTAATRGEGYRPRLHGSHTKHG